MKYLLFTIAFALFFASCSDNTNSNSENQDTLAKDEKNDTPDLAIDANELQTELLNMRLGSMMKPFKIEGKTLKVNFFGEFENYKKAFPMCTQDEFKLAYEDTKDIEKAFVENPVKVFYKYSNIEQVNMKLVLAEQKYSIELTQKQLTDYCGQTIDEIKKDYAKFQETYFFDAVKRKEFFDKFVKTN